MKKLLVIALSAIMVFAFAAVSMAAVEIAGEYDATVNTINDTVKSEVGLYLNAPIIDNLSAYVGFWGWADATSNAWELDEASFTLKTGAGSFTVGKISYELGNLALISEPEQTANLALYYENAISEKVTVKVFYNPGSAEYNDLGDKVADRVDDITFGMAYATDAFGADFNYVNSTAEDAEDIYFLNGFYSIVENAKVYGSYESLGEDNAFLFVGGSLTFNKLTVEAEYSALVPEVYADADETIIGYKLSYAVNDKLPFAWKRTINDFLGEEDATCNKITAVCTF